MRATLSFLVIVVVGLSVWNISANSHTKTPSQTNAQKTTLTTKTSQTTKIVNACSGNTLSQEAIVSISKRHMWACSTTSLLYDSPVVTGMENYPADLTPVGTYQVYAKEVDLYLSGSDSTGSWNDFVNYWLPFLDNQYGVYGFHDATWRPSSAFGNISPYTNQASHGCVELPLSAAAWLYKWANIGLTVVIEA